MFKGIQNRIHLLFGKQKPKIANGIVREQIIFTGHVQHVGFRYELSVTAEKLGVTGEADNQQDGTVRAELQGTAAAIETVLQKIQSVPRFRIDSINRSPLSPVPGEKGFGCGWR